MTGVFPVVLSADSRTLIPMGSDEFSVAVLVGGGVFVTVAVILLSSGVSVINGKLIRENGVSVKKVGLAIGATDITVGVTVGTFWNRAMNGGNWNNTVIKATVTVPMTVIKVTTTVGFPLSACFGWGK